MAAPIRLTFACGLYDRMLSLYTGEVKPRGLELEYLAMENPREVFDRMARGQEFDAAEMSSSEFISRLSARECPFVAIPVFPSRFFRHGFIAINTRSVRGPKDLAGKRIGVPLYTMTAAIWIRGLLQHEYAVDLSTVRWIEGKINKPGGHGNPAVLPTVRPVNVQPNDSGKSLSQLLAEGEIDAIAGTELPESMRRSPDVRRLFPDFREVERAYFERTRIFPIMHLVAIRSALYERHPWIAASLYEAFESAKARALTRMRSMGALSYMLPWLPADLDEIDELFGGDPWPYGVEANRPTLQAMLDYMLEQSIIGRKLHVEELFVPITQN